MDGGVLPVPTKSRNFKAHDRIFLKYSLDLRENQMLSKELSNNKSQDSFRQKIKIQLSGTNSV